MQKVKIFGTCLLVFFLALLMIIPALRAEKEYKVTPLDLREHKRVLDDPRPYLKALSYKKVLPPEVYARLTYDVEAMKKLWSEVVGFKAPDVVGKIAPEIKAGTYTYKDKERYPGFKELMTPDLYKRFNPGAPPLAGNFPEIKVVPTRQYYWALPIAEATKEYMGRTKLDDKGILREETYVAGFPFPRPSGKFKANQIINNYLKRYINWENSYMAVKTIGITSSFRIDNEGDHEAWNMRLKGRVLMEPYGWADKRAQKMGEYRGFAYRFITPRDMSGNVITTIKYLDPDKFDQMLLYVNVLRRARVLSATDIQDAVGGSDGIYADDELYSQKISTTIFPYKCEVIDEREFLIPFTTWDGSVYLSSKGFEYHNLEFERRPIYVVKMSQLDKNFVYSYRILYIDKETLLLHYLENYDQKGRLYRNSECIWTFIPEMGMFTFGNIVYRDQIDRHSTYLSVFMTPASWISRKHLGLRSLFVKGK